MDSREPQVRVTLYMPAPVGEKLERLVKLTGLTKAGVVRLLLVHFDEANLPPSLVEHADALRAARAY